MTELPPDMESHIERIPEAGCWIWSPATDSAGYAKARIQGVTYLAHRAVYALWYGPIPPGLVIDHLCQVKCCVNPSHLEAVTQPENVRRSHIFRRKTGYSPHIR